MLPQRPRHMLPHQRRRMIGAPPQRRHDLRRRPSKSAPHCPSRPRDCAASAQWPMRRIGLPSSLRLNSPHPRQTVRPGWRGRARCAPSKSGTLARCANLFHGQTSLAVVAAVHAVADQRPQLDRDAALQFDGQVGNAAPRIEPVRPEDRLRRAGVDAGAAAAAMVAAGRVDRQRQIGVESRRERTSSRLRGSSSSVCLPRQPRPAFSASATSITGAESVNTR